MGDECQYCGQEIMDNDKVMAGGCAFDRICSTCLKYRLGLMEALERQLDSARKTLGAMEHAHQVFDELNAIRRLQHSLSLGSMKQNKMGLKYPDGRDRPEKGE